MKVDIVVTRHPATVELLRENGIDVDNAKVVTHTTSDEVRGKVVAGVLPLSLASECKAVIVADLKLSSDDRGKELNLDELRKRFIGLSIYKVNKI